MAVREELRSSQEATAREQKLKEEMLSETIQVPLSLLSFSYVDNEKMLGQKADRRCRKRTGRVTKRSREQHKQWHELTLYRGWRLARDEIAS